MRALLFGESQIPIAFCSETDGRFRETPDQKVGDREGQTRRLTVVILFFFRLSTYIRGQP